MTNIPMPHAGTWVWLAIEAPAYCVQTDLFWFYRNGAWICAGGEPVLPTIH